MQEVNAIDLGTYFHTEPVFHQLESLLQLQLPMRRHSSVDLVIGMLQAGGALRL